jgi:hypothetical protein
MMFSHTFWHIFNRNPDAAPHCRPHPLLFGFTANTDHPRAWEVQPGCGTQSGTGPVRTPISFWSRAVESAGGGGFAIRLDLSLFLSGLLAPHRSRQGPETGRLYSAVTHHTHNTLHVRGYLYFDLDGLSLLVRKWGPTYLTQSVTRPAVAGSFRVKIH